MVSSKELFNVSSSVLVNNTLAYIQLFSLEGTRIELLIAWFAAICNILEWNLFITVTIGQKISGCNNIEVAAL